MKRIILIFGLIVVCLGLSAQTWSRYGIRVGLYSGLMVVDSIKKVGNSAHFYDGATNLGTLWDGAGTALVAATGRTSLGATTVGAAFFMLTNPGAITFVRINADNSITALSDANFKTALSLTSTDVGLNNVTNKAQVELEDSALMAGGYTTYSDGVAGLALKLNKADSALMAGGYTSYADGLVTSSGLAAKLNKADSALMAGGYTSYADGIAGLALKLNKADSALMAGGYFSYSDGIAGLALKLNKADSALMAGGYFSYSDGIAGLALKINKADSVNYASGYMSRYDGVTGDAGKLAKADSGVWAGGYATPKDLDDAVLGLTDTVALETIVTLQSDTVPLFVFGAGGGNEADTALFTTSTLYGSFFNKGSDSLIITELRAVMLAGTTPLGTDTLSVQVYWNDTINKTGVSSVSINTNPLGINSVTVGTVDASFNNSTIPPNVWVFCKTPGVVTGRKPNYLSITLSGHKINRKY